MAKSQKIPFKNFVWTNFTRPAQDEVEKLRTVYNFHPLDIQECISPSQRTQINIWPAYSFLVFLLPIFNPRTREIQTAELDVFIGKNFLITVDQAGLKPFNALFEIYRISTDLRRRYSEGSPERLLYEVLNKLYLAIYPMLGHLSIDCDTIEKAIFAGQEREMVSEIMVIRRNIIDFRKLMQAHKNTLKRLTQNLKANPLFVMKRTDVYFESLTDYSKEIWELLDNLKERIEALQETNESQISFRLSDIMRTLTIISVITFPLTLLAATFGMNTVASMPLINNPYGFWIIVAIMVSVITGMLAIFKTKRWM